MADNPRVSHDVLSIPGSRILFHLLLGFDQPQSPPAMDLNPSKLSHGASSHGCSPHPLLCPGFTGKYLLHVSVINEKSYFTVNYPQPM